MGSCLMCGAPMQETQSYKEGRAKCPRCGYAGTNINLPNMF